MALLGTAASGKYDGAYFLFSWTGKKMTVPGQTKINWTIYRKGRTQSPYWYSNGYSIKISANGETKETLSRIWKSAGNRTLKESDDSFRDNKNFVVGSGSFVVEHEANGEATISVNFERIQIFSSANIGGQLVEFSLDTNYPYTKCKAPTTLTALVENTSRGTIKPDGKENIHLSWSGASGGIGNSIKGYNIYCRITAVGTAPTFDTYKLATVDNSTTEYGVTQEELKEITGQKSLDEFRGQKIIFGINAYGEIAGYASDMKVANTMIVNSLPGAPLIQNWAQENIVVSTTEKVNFEVIPGKDAQSYQGLSVQYRTNSLEAFRAYASEEINIVQGENNFEFATFDGLEYSKSTIIKIIKNLKPEVSLNIEGKNLSNEDEPYCLSLKINAYPHNGQSGKDTYTYMLKYSSDKLEWATKTIRKDGPQTIVVDDIRSFAEPGTQAGYYYKIACKRNDSIEESDEVESSDIFYVTKVPTNWSITSTAESLSEYFSTKVKILSDQFDIGYQNLSIQIMGATDNLVIATEKIVIAQDGTTSLNATSLQPGYQYKFQIISAGSEYYQYTLSDENIQTTTLTKILSPPKDLVAAWGETINPFIVDEGGQNIAITNFLKGYEPKDYGFNNTPNFTILAKSGTKQSQLTGLAMITDTNGGDNAYVSLSGQQIFNLFYGEGNILELDVKSLAGQIIQIELETVNLFGDKYVYRLNKNINFTTYAPESQLDSGVIMSCINDGIANVYREGQIWQIQTKYFSYYGAPKDIQLSLVSVKKDEINNDTAVQKTVTLSRVLENFSFVEENEIEYGVPASYDLTVRFEAIPEIEEEQVVKLIQIEVIDGIGTEFVPLYSKEDGFSILRKCVNPTITLTNGRYEQRAGGEWAILVDVSRSYGVEDANEKTLVYWEYQYLDENGKWQSGDKSFEGEQLVAEVGDKQSWQFRTIRLSGTYEYKLEIEGETTSTTITKVGISNELIIYNSLPTVSYRSNQLGINYKIPPSNQASEGLLKNSALIVGEHSEKRYISILGSGTGSGSQVFIDIQTGQLLYFTIDGGSWDKI